MKQDNLKVALGIANSCPKGRRLSGTVTDKGISLSPLINLQKAKRWPLYLPSIVFALSLVTLGGALAHLSLTYSLLALIAMPISLRAIMLALSANRPAYSIDEDTHRWFWHNVIWAHFLSALSSLLSALIAQRLMTLSYCCITARW